MSGPTIALIHAVAPAMPPMRETLAAELPEARVLNLLDEGLLSEVERRGGLTPECVARLTTQVGLAIDAGADAVLLTCTAYSPVVGEVQAHFPNVPVLAVDQVMIDQAVSQARRIGVLGTVPAGIAQQVDLLEQAAAASGKEIVVIQSVHPAAMAALQRGDGDTHDEILLAALPALAAQVDVVLLGQASMARLKPRLPALPVPVLTSPALAVARLREVLDHTADARTVH
jgi:Asp/Glu/hydantoin racemase